MRKKRPRADFVALQRKQLDEQLRLLAQMRSVHPPRGGWVRAVRSALGMTTVQLGKRLGMTKQGVVDLEKREATESITVGSLRNAADALNCDLIVAVVPKTSLEDTVRLQARLKAARESNRLIHTMRLEGQEEGVPEMLGGDEKFESWPASRTAQLWD